MVIGRLLGKEENQQKAVIPPLTLARASITTTAMFL